MKEYWVNVYDNPKMISTNWPTRIDAKIAACGVSPVAKILYRIHVKMKEIKPLMHQRAGRIRRPLTTHWMDD